MNGGTYTVLGLGAGVVAASTMEPELPTMFIVMAGAASALIPNLDEARSMIYSYTMRNVHPRMRRPLVGLIGMELLFFSVLELSFGFLLAGVYFLAVSLNTERFPTCFLLMMTGIGDEIHPDLVVIVFLGYLTTCWRTHLRFKVSLGCGLIRDFYLSLLPFIREQGLFPHGIGHVPACRRPREYRSTGRFRDRGRRGLRGPLRRRLFFQGR